MVLIGLGSNRGDSRDIVMAALSRMGQFAVGAVKESSLWRTSPVDCPPGSGDFINAVAAFEARQGLSPRDLLSALKCLEREFGRKPGSVRHAPRELDLDLLLFDHEQRDEPDFVLPHPRAVNRRFVLAPAAEVAPDVIWPGTGRTVQALLEDLGSGEQASRLQSHATV